MDNTDAIRDDIRERIRQFHKLSLNVDFVNSFNLTTTFAWDYLGWTQQEWDDFISLNLIPEREFTNKVEQKEDTNTVNNKPSFPLQRHFTRDTNPYYDIIWQKRQALITKADGEVVFQQDDVEFPAFWSQNATNIVASKYFRMINGKKESHVKSMIERVAGTIANWGREDGYFSDNHERDIFLWELSSILVHQMASFNSPVWFNIGVPGTAQQASACYILSVEDSMPAILEWYRQEGMIFSRGSGSGVNVSKLRGKGEPISRGGVSSGPLSFMRAADASAFSIKSGGTTRRSARMVVMDMDHPDIEEFIFAKMIEERKARVLAQAGYDDSLDGEIYATVAHQNCNMSVSASDEFLQRVEEDDIWVTSNRTNYEGHEHNARKLFRSIAEAARDCGDPGCISKPG